MSRRRPKRGQHRHLERTEAIAAVVDQAVSDSLESRGPCPGPCNVRWHRFELDRPALFLQERARAEVVARRAYTELLMQKGAPVSKEILDAGILDVADQLDEAAHQHVEQLTPTARPGRPTWCFRCAAEIDLAVRSLPRLIAWTVDIGAVLVPTRLVDGMPVPVDAPAAVLDVLWRWDDDGVPTAVEELDCGHRYTRRPAGPGPSPASRQCRTCVAGTSLPEPGRLAPPPRVERRGGGPAQRVSPAGSRSWLEVQEALVWLCSRASKARDALGTSPLTYAGDTGSMGHRYREAVNAARWLTDHNRVRQVLELDSSFAVTFGKEATAIARRLLLVSGRDALEHKLPASCPVCDRRALVRHDGADVVVCKRCHNEWAEPLYRHLARVQAADVQANTEPGP